MGDIQYIQKLPICPYEVWDQTQVQSTDWMLSTDDRKTLQIRSGKQFERVVKSFTPNHGVRLRGAVFDKARKRIITIGRDEPSRTEVDEFGGEGSLRVWDFNGKSLQSQYVFDNEPMSIARDLHTDHMVVGVRGGGVHVFRSDHNGVEVISHGNLDFTLSTSVAMSASGSFYAAAGAGGAKIWKNGNAAPKIDIFTGFLPEESSGAVTIIHDSNTYTTGRAVVLNGNHVRVYQLGDDITLQQEFDLEIPGAVEIGPSAHDGEIVIIGINGDGPRGSPAPFPVYSLNVDTKILTKLSWKSATLTQESN